MVNVEFAGRVYPPFGPYRVGREKIREFARAVGAHLPQHHDLAAARAQGYGDLVAPVTFAVTIAQAAEAQLIEDPGADIDFSRVVHADERFEHVRPLVAGDDVVTVLTVVSIKERAGLAMVSTRADIHESLPGDEPGELISSVHSTLAVRLEA
ncbi:FAS1-like dehydratase domain-containing protein [Rarobacter incanus]|uniref:Acyl dehydratase n=1 Tax=Rarobacter incanus TaxID=153494 RepID=A0A542SQW8_9MICO|nr:MaoC family dehydratase N-terminal domain-containing protein [Rarobacter incanus]TQK77016.1 acyl dehydratase [Rarobacter incanus]